MKIYKVFAKIFSVICLLTIILVLTLAVIDYTRIKKLEEPKFCLDYNVIEYDDGAVEVCTGIGYKVISYHRTSFEAVEFGPYWIKVRTDFSEYKN